MKSLLLFSYLFYLSYSILACDTPPKKAVAVLKGTSEQIELNGDLEFVESKDGTVVLRAVVQGLRPLTQHAIHIHQNGDCGNGGKNAGGHWNPQNMDHGHLHQKSIDSTPAHKGDIGNLLADENGVAKLTIQTTEWCIECDDESKNILGKAVIVHEGKDDFKTQPTGGAGGRIGCGIIEKWKMVDSEK